MNLNTFTHKLTRIIIDILFFTCIIAIATIPWWGHFAQTYMMIGKGMYIILYLAGVTSLYILWLVRAFFKTFQQGNPFEEENVTRLRNCSIAFFVNALIFAVKIIFVYTNAALLLVVMFGILGLACLTIKDLFKQAIKHKQENDLTI